MLVSLLLASGLCHPGRVIFHLRGVWCIFVFLLLVSTPDQTPRSDLDLHCSSLGPKNGTVGKQHPRADQACCRYSLDAGLDLRFYRKRVHYKKILANRAYAKQFLTFYRNLHDKILQTRR